ncbi:MAG TPA: DNA-binding transcriptional regulator Fis [Gammaproteobacteria bacterium]|nr:DNA-binding transcriptional regulator Fis [Gammaproteobacteria bacterium]HAU06539.1 DNA-binding transcriptional regulator Fis [Gammaproteobacteria bacterium]
MTDSDTSSAQPTPPNPLSSALHTKDYSLNHCVEHAIKEYFQHLEGHHTDNLYELLLSQVEPPMLKATLEHTGGNQCRAAEALGINRGTLRKKLKHYGLIP